MSQIKEYYHTLCFTIAFSKIVSNQEQETHCLTQGRCFLTDRNQKSECSSVYLNADTIVFSPYSYEGVMAFDA